MMNDYIEGLIMEPPMDLATGPSATPTASHLFQVNEDCTNLNPEDAKHFHHLTAKSLYLCKQTCPYLQTVVAFLSTHVHAPDTDDWKNLVHYMRYLQGMKDFPSRFLPLTPSSFNGGLMPHMLLILIWKATQG